MANKPVIVYIESESDGFSSENYTRAALYYCLKEEYGCKVMLYNSDHYFKSDIEQIVQLCNQGHLVLVIVSQEKYSDQHEDVIKLVRSNISNSLPIVVIPNPGAREEVEKTFDDPQVYVFRHYDAELIELVNSLKAKWQPPPQNWLGAETKHDQDLLFSQLENAYHKHYLGENENGMMGTPDFNHMVVAEALRIKLLPTEHLAAEFNATIERLPRTFEPASDSVYEQEVDKISKMTAKERKEFSDDLARARGYQPIEGGGVYVVSASCGSNVNGFAIDYLTKETLITTRYGEHHMADQLLTMRLKAIEGIKHGKYHHMLFNDDVESSCRQRVVSGLIFSNFSDFTTPILSLYQEWMDEEKFEQATRYIRQEQKFIPVRPDGKLLGELSTKTRRKIVLETAEPEEIQKLMQGDWQDHDEVFIPYLVRGTIVRVRTVSNNVYFFEITDPEKCQAHVYRMHPRAYVPKNGYRGERKISEKIEIDSCVHHDYSRTSSAMKISTL